MEFSVNQRAKQYSKCCFTNCKSHILSKDSLSFFTFPKEPARCAVWIENCKNDQLKTIKNLAVNTKYRLCSLHFEADMFSNFQKNRLKSEAIPTLFDAIEVECVDEPDKNDDPECSTLDFMPLSCSMPEDIIYQSTGTKCALSFCKNIYTQTGEEGQLLFFNFPEDPVRFAIWVENCDPKYLPKVDLQNLKKKHKLCSMHFEDRMFNFKKNSLLSNAVPTLFKDKFPVITSVTSQSAYETVVVDDDKIPPPIPIDAIPSCSKYDKYISQNLFDVSTATGLVKNSVSLQTPAYLSAKSPRKLKLKERLSEEINMKKRLEKTVFELKKQIEETNTESNCIKLCKMYLPPTMFMLVKNHLLNKNKAPNGQRHPNEIVEFANTVRHLGPKTYNFLQKYFTLPHLRTLRKKTVHSIDKNVQNLVQNDHKYSKI